MCEARRSHSTPALAGGNLFYTEISGSIELKILEQSNRKVLYSLGC